MTAAVPQWDAHTYEASQGHHRSFDDWFLDGFPGRPGQRVLDLGCGTGHFTRRVADLLADGEVVGVDASAAMIAEARRRGAPNLGFLVGTMQALDALVAAHHFDGIMSRAALHWIPADDLAGVLAGCARVLRPGGWLRVECGGGDNCRRARALLDDVSTALGGPRSPWNFLAAGAALEGLEAAGFTAEEGWVQTVAQRRRFERDEVIGWLRSQCFQAYDPGLSPAGRVALRTGVEDRIDELRHPDGTFDQIFVRLDIHVRRR
jgi:ubiquinone/menaquinone biosynthesis C-methylase UbiE